MSLYFASSLKFSGDVMIAASCGRPSDDLAHLDDLHPVGLAVDLVPIRDELVVVGEEVVVPDVVAEELLRRRDLTLRTRRGGHEHDRQQATLAACQKRNFRIDIQTSEQGGKSERRRRPDAGRGGGAKRRKGLKPVIA